VSFSFSPLVSDMYNTKEENRLLFNFVYYIIEYFSSHIHSSSSVHFFFLINHLIELNFEPKKREETGNE
jgi:hypothetical protein